MENQEFDEFEKQKTDISLFALGIILAIMSSLLVETGLLIFNIRYDSLITRIIFIISALLLFFVYILYRRITGYPDMIEYEIKFIVNDKVKWTNFEKTFSDNLEEEIRKKRKSLYLSTNLLSSVTQRIWGYKRYSIVKWHLFDWIASFYVHKNLSKIQVLVSTSKFKKDIITSFENTLTYLKEIGFIKEISQPTKPISYLMSWFFPFIKKQ